VGRAGQIGVRGPRPLHATTDSALRVGDLAGSIDFYSKLFNTEPTKLRPGYANFAIIEPTHMPCSMVQPSPWVGLQPIGQGQTLSGGRCHLHRHPRPTPGPDSINPSYQLEVIQPGATPTQPYLNWSNVTTWRCDNLVNSYAGCAIPAYTPTLGISFSQRGAAATYDWAQINLPDHWGSSSKNQPLHRLAMTQTVPEVVSVLDFRNRFCGTTSGTIGQAVAHGRVAPGSGSARCSTSKEVERAPGKVETIR
jgi:hypothetical protein